MYIGLIVFGIFILIIIGIAIYFHFDMKKIEKEYADSIKAIDEKYERIKENKYKTINRLNEALTSLCTLLNIDLSYHDYLDIAAGRILYKSINGRLIVDDAKIQILNKCKDEPYVLAHEIGHYLAIKQREDDTEEGADSEALNICNTILTPEEREYIADELRIYFESKLKSA